VIINNTGGSGTGDHKVAVDSTDGSADYLGAKILAGAVNNGLQIVPLVDTVTEVMKINAVIDPVQLFQYLIDALSTDSGLYANFCAAVAGCPSPCDAPTNVVVTYTAGTTTTTTTTSTTTTTTTTL
jgi:dissimilatory sulfite reductase (desulfoviridin) alpha/beta subunit